jgi:hypothetical protein
MAPSLDAELCVELGVLFDDNEAWLAGVLTHGEETSVGSDLELAVLGDRNVACVRVGSLWIIATGSDPIADEAWRSYLQHMAASVAKHGPLHGILTWAPKHGPSTTQRKMLTGEFADAVQLSARRRMAVVSDSTVVRGTLIAINWVAGKKLLSFALQEVDLAFDWLAEDAEFDRAVAERALPQAAAALEPPHEKAGARRREVSSRAARRTRH